MSDHEPCPILEDYACKVCGNVPDKNGTIEHGRGCYVVSEDGGGISSVNLPSAEDHLAGEVNP